jgi:hypothetical protein
LNSYNKDLDKNFIELITNRFYTNFLSKNLLEPQLFYIISTFLKKEINELNYDKKYDFLKKTICHKIFKQLIRNSEFIKYFREIIKDIIKDVYIHSQSKNNEIYDIIMTNKILLSIPMLEEKINEKRNEEKKIKEKNKNIKNNIYKKNKNENNINKAEDISKKYLQNVTKSFLEEKFDEYKNNIMMKDYCEVQLKNFGKFINEHNQSELYTNNNLFNRISSSSIKEVDIVYKRNLILAIHFMNNFLDIINKKINEVSNNTLLASKTENYCSFNDLDNLYKSIKTEMKNEIEEIKIYTQEYIKSFDNDIQICLDKKTNLS